MRSKSLFLSAFFMAIVFACSAQCGSASFSIDRWKSKITQLNIQLLDGQCTTLSHELQDEKFEDLFSVRKGIEKVRLMCKDRKDGLREVVFLAEGKDGGLYIRCTGKFTQHDLDQMTSSLKD
ncbi:MAG: DUF4252 domain-containing protein [Chitinophagaceae bacterium]|nr:DUF4252 domain-containing protein [Chitinophagaceae bacterium]